MKHAHLSEVTQPNKMQHLDTKIFKINRWKPIGMFFGWLFISLFLGLMSFDLVWRYVTNFQEANQQFPILIATIGVLLPYAYITFSTFRALLKLFTPYKIVMDTDGIQINTGRKTRAWGKIKWEEIENISFQSLSSFSTGWMGMDTLVILLRKDSPHVGVQTVTLLKAKYMLRCSILLFADIDEIRKTAKEYNGNRSFR